MYNKIEFAEFITKCFELIWFGFNMVKILQEYKKLVKKTIEILTDNVPHSVSVEDPTFADPHKLLENDLNTLMYEEITFQIDSSLKTASG
jgi:hypothetical protein